jgi:hypothetical protein
LIEANLWWLPLTWERLQNARDGPLRSRDLCRKIIGLHREKQGFFDALVRLDHWRPQEAEKSQRTRYFSLSDCVPALQDFADQPKCTLGMFVWPRLPSRSLKCVAVTWLGSFRETDYSYASPFKMSSISCIWNFSCAWSSWSHRNVAGGVKVYST